MMRQDSKTGLYLPGVRPSPQEKLHTALTLGISDKRLLEDGRLMPSILGGSAISGSYSEVFHVNKDSSGTPADGTELNTFTAEASLLGALFQPIIPAEFFDRDRGTGKVLHATAMGVLSTTGTPTFAFTCRLGTTSGGTLLGQTTTLTTASGVTNAVWVLDLYLLCTAVGSAGSLRTSGAVFGPTAFASPFAGTIPHNSASWQGTIDTTVANSLWFGAICGTSSASNKIQLKTLIIRGLN